MANFQTSVDIANRACQHTGVARINTFLDDVKQATEIAACYDKLREAELRRNVWTFSVRKAALRPITTTTTLLTPAAYNAATTYAQGAVVTYLGQIWESLTAGNLASTPANDGSNWELYAGPRTIRAFALNSGATASDVAYFSGELVLSGGLVYRSLISNNSDIPPTANWLSLGAVSGPLTILYPIGSGPADQTSTRNVFLLPAAYLRLADQDPKAGAVSFLGASSHASPSDWVPENGYITSQCSTVIILRFAASVTRVNLMDPMFCEGLGARIGLEVCEALTQSTEKMQSIGASYKTFMSEARDVNGIETGPVESPEDDWVLCRL